MSIVSRSLAAVFLIAGLTSGVMAQGLLPERRSQMTQDMDLPGGDLRSLFNTTLESCERACLTDTRCTAFTFNSRNGSCFPKSQSGAGTPYQGAISGQVATTPTTAQALAAERRGDLRFVPSYRMEQALAQARAIGRDHLTMGLDAQTLRQSALVSEQAGDVAYAARLYGAAIAVADAGEDWAAYANMLQASAARQGNQGRGLLEMALSAQINAYLRAGSAGLRHSVLVQMATTQEQLGQGRAALAAARQAQMITPRDDTAVLLARLEGLFGFRIEEHEVQSDLASPRICARFTEDLVDSGLDYTPFVQLPEPGLTVEPGEWRTLCVGGLRHGERYSLTFRAGLPAADGQVLTKSVTITAYVRDRAPSAQFAGRAYVLPVAGGAFVPVDTVNATTLDLELYAVTDRNLIRAMRQDYFARQMEVWQSAEFSEAVAERLWQGQATVERVVNQTVTTRLPLTEALQGRGAGIYALKAQVPGVDVYASPPVWQWFVVSDLGLTSFSGADGVHVVARSLQNASAKPGVQVELLARSNRVLGRAQTDDQGVARFDASLAAGTGAAQPALVVVTEGDKDIAFLSLLEPEFDLSDRGVAGRPAPPPIDLFLTTDRGAYRAGEVINATALARDGQARAIAGLPLTAVLKRPDGLEYSRARIDDQNGGYVFAMPVAQTAPRGVWRLEVLADTAAAPLASLQVLVEDFLPERIDFDLSAPETPVSPGGTMQVDLSARYLFGAPGAGLAGEADVILRAVDGLAAWPGYRFGREGQAFDPQMSSLAPFVTDDSGAARLAALLPSPTTPGHPLEAVLRVRVAEGSGRPVERVITRPIVQSDPLIGLKPAFSEALPENGTAEVQVIAVDATGPVALPVKWRLDRIETRYQWYSLQGSWNWEPVTTRSRVAEGTAQTGAEPVLVSALVTWGEYELTVERDGGPFAASSLRFSAGWHAPADAARSPDMLEMSLDQPSYRAGDTATLRMVPRFAGVALVSVLSDRVVHMQTMAVTEGENLLPLSVTDDWGAGAYVTATVLRPMDVAAGRNPARTMGLAHASVAPGARQLDVTFDAPTASDPRAPLTATLRVSGVAAGETAFATVAAVDQGILNLTAFKAPDPSAHYFGQRRLGVGVRDLYGRLIDGLNGAAGTVRSGGDAGTVRLQSAPPTEELVAYFTGPVEIGPDGTAQVSFDMPSFNGSVRLMAVVWSDTAVGQAQAEVLVRDPVVVSASLPRFMAPGDEARLLLEITHAAGPFGRMGLDVAGTGVTLGAVPSGVDLAERGKASVVVPVVADAEGLAQITVSLTAPDGRVLRKDLALAVQVNDPETMRYLSFEMQPGQMFELTDDVLAGLHPATARATISVGTAARFNTAGLLSALDAYDYGCSEQITSRALPLLALGPTAQALGLAGADTFGTRINQTIADLLLNQTTEGGFGLWSAGRGGDLWLDAYVTDFLSRARAQGHEVPQAAFRAALDNLRNRVNYYGDFEQGGGDLAFALMVLAREGAAAIGDLRYYADVKAADFDTAIAVAQLGAALALYGDQPRADALMARASGMALAASAQAQVWRDDFGSPLRDSAAVLTLAAEVGSAAVNRTGLLAQLAGQSATTLSTQEAAWMLLASASDTQGADVLLNGVSAGSGPVRVLRPGDAPISVMVGGESASTMLVTAFGVESGQTQETASGYMITRRYFTTEGQAADIASVKAGTRLVAVLDITPLDIGEARLMVADPLPAGFEIDSPNLLESGRIAGLEWLETETDVTHSEFRQDRFLTALDRRDNAPFALAYMLRAVTPGTYHHPAASVEDMYRPSYRATTASGRVIVTP